MTLFESAIRKLNIPLAIIEGITAIRKICMEADEQSAESQSVKSATDQEPPAGNKPATQPQQQGDNTQKTSETPDTQNPPQEGENEPEKSQSEPPSTTQEAGHTEEKINENQVDSQKLMQMFANYLDGCKQKVNQALVRQFGENGKIIIEEVEKYTKANSPINFDEEIVPLLRTNDKEYPDQKIIDDVRNRLQKYFGLKIASSEQQSKQPSSGGQKEDDDSSNAHNESDTNDTGEAKE